MKKQLPTDNITKELSKSVFFQRSASGESESQQDAIEHSPPPPPQEEQPKVNQASNQDGMTDVTPDVMTSQLQEVNLKKWQEIIEDTETQNSALRLTSEERYAVEDVVSELRRKHGIKTSMNEVARLGLLVLMHDFKQNKKESIIYKLKKA
jgi:hypothetical protein